MWPPHGHRHTATATRPPPHGHRHTVTATRPSHPRPGHVPSHVPGHVPGHVMSHVPSCVDTFDHGNLPGPLALGHSRRPLALWHPRPLLPFGPWPLFPRGQHPSSTMADGGLCLSAALGAVAPLALGGLQPTAASNLRRPLAHGAPLATIGYQGVVIRNGRVIEPIERGGGHSGLGGISWWCGGMSWKWCGRKPEGYEVLLGASATGWPTLRGKARRGVPLLPHQHAAHGHSFLG